MLVYKIALGTSISSGRNLPESPSEQNVSKDCRKHLYVVYLKSKRGGSLLFLRKNHRFQFEIKQCACIE